MAQVLLVEDDAAIRTALTRALRDHGHGVASVGSGLPALGAAVENKGTWVAAHYRAQTAGGVTVYGLS